MESDKVFFRGSIVGFLLKCTCYCPWLDHLMILIYPNPSGHMYVEEFSVHLPY